MATASATTKKAEVSGKLKFKDVKILVNEETNDEIVVSQSAKISIGNYDHEIPSGAILRVKEGDTVQAGDILADIDPYHVPIICDQDGTVEFKEIYIKANYDEKYDVTEYLAVKPVESGDANPRLIVYDKDHNPKASYPIPFGAYLMVKEGDKVTKGQILAKLIKEGEGTKDITGGLPRIQELFEARNPKGKALLTEIDGKVEITAKKRKGMRVIIIRNEKDPDLFREYLVSVGDHLVVTDGMLIKSGDKITEGAISPFDILNIKGLVAAEQFILESVQQVYRDQGVTVNDKHIEIIVKQMFKKVRITNSGSSLLLEDEVVEKRLVDLENEELKAKGKKLVEYEPVIQGITKAAVNTESFISAASFQETTKVLSNAAIEGKEDYLEGLKENVIIGKKIPAGTGYVDYRNVVPAEVKEEQ